MLNNPQSVLITGANSGIGAELARQYSAPGVNLFLVARRIETLEEIAHECRAKGAEVSIKSCDIRERQILREWILEADQKKPLDLVIANAGIGGEESFAGQFGEDEETVRKFFAINTDGVLNTIEPIKPLMAQRGKGQIVLMSSLSSYFGMPDSPAYCGSKAAVRVYGEALRSLLKPHGVSVNVVCPGFVKTPMSDQLPFKLPFLWSVEKACQHIRKCLAKDKARISFPWVLSFACWLGMALPAHWTSALMMRNRKIPFKPGEHE